VKELVVCSGKGGTGKTSLLAAFAALAPGNVCADCDVDAADLHLLLAPLVVRREPFISGREAVIRPDRCNGCGDCAGVCAYGAVLAATAAPNAAPDAAPYRVDPLACEGCGVCVHFCPEDAIDFPRRRCGTWFVSTTRHGTLVHAELGIAGENSGRLVTLVRQEARRIAASEQCDLILVDGPPGIGCPAIATVTGADLVLAVTEPSLSGRHDLERLHALTRHFEVPLTVCINKADINPPIAMEIVDWCAQRLVPVSGTIPYDDAITAAQIAGVSVVEYGESPATPAVRRIWQRVRELLVPESAPR
jgi:MinD superfamily P-loop ATPase